MDRFTAATEGLGAQASDEDRDALRASGLGHVSRILAALGSTEAGDGGLAGACTRRPNGPAEGRLTRGWNIGAPRVSSPDAGRVVCAETCATTGSAVPGAPADGSGSRCERSRQSQAHAAHQRCGRRPTVDAQWRCAGSAAATRRECGDAQVRDDSSSASRRAKQNDATAQPCPARPSRACLASRTNRVPVVTRIGGRGDGAAVDDGPGCRRRADANGSRAGIIRAAVTPRSAISAPWSTKGGPPPPRKRHDVYT